MEKYLSRKFFLTLIVLGLVAFLPSFYKQNAVSDTIAMAVLVILASVGAAYGFINIKDAKLGLEKNAQELVEGKVEIVGVVSESAQAPK